MTEREINELALKHITRRHLFKMTSYGIGTLALGSMLNPKLLGATPPAENPFAVRPPHFAPKAKRVIFLFMAGAPSQLDLFDPKPKLNEHDREPIPESFVEGERFAFIKGTPKLLGSPHKFAQHGQSGQWISELLPYTANVADDLCVIRSVVTDQFNHAPAQIFSMTGHQLPGRPSIGSWLLYGLGAESQDLPGFVVLVSGINNPDGGKALWSNGFLPSHYQGVEFRSKGDPVLYVSDPEGMDRTSRREMLDVIRQLNEIQLTEQGDPEIATRISNYELAFRMQASVPELTDLSNETPETHALYGTAPGQVSFANNCMLARRLAERGCRFIQLYHRGWDSHGTSPGDDIMASLPARCREVDQACAALITDLKQRGMLDETLVVWGGEFGRTPMNEERDGSTYLGRDHHPRAFTIWMAGGGIKPGVSFGATDELGYNITENPVHVHDLNATILHLMGLDHTRLTYNYLGRDFRLTDVHGEVVQGILA
ncbi:MAG: DUF1501 domain-containing protein [Fimbriimonadaceae bacterium]|nr:DUF1501 domain-containing protein [Fimbriimonadaceae bacterium]